MNPTKSSFLIFLIFAGICILSILASPSVPRRHGPSSTTESPDGPESDQLLLIFKRQAPLRRQEVSSTTQASSDPPSDQLFSCPHCGEGLFGRRRRQVPPRPPRRQGVSSTTSDPLAAAPSDQWDVPENFQQGADADDQSSGPDSEQLTRQKRRVPPRPLRRQGGSSTAQPPSGPASDQIAGPVEHDRRKRKVPPRRQQGGSSTAQPPRAAGGPPRSAQLTKRTVVAIQKRSPQYNMGPSPPQPWPVMPMPWQAPPPPPMGWPGPPPPTGGEWPGGQPSPAVSGGIWPVPPPWPQQPAVAKA